jgi:pimeloyl-ACP methyl ester carboxylesterase
LSLGVSRVATGDGPHRRRALDHRAAIERLFRKARLVTIPGAGHWLHAERREAFLERVTPFLAGGN